MGGDDVSANTVLSTASRAAAQGAEAVRKYTKDAGQGGGNQQQVSAFFQEALQQYERLAQQGLQLLRSSQGGGNIGARQWMHGIVLDRSVRFDAYSQHIYPAAPPRATPRATPSTSCRAPWPRAATRPCCSTPGRGGTGPAPRCASATPT